jgi:hypothetical protein
MNLLGVLFYHVYPTWFQSVSLIWDILVFQGLDTLCSSFIFFYNMTHPEYCWNIARWTLSHQSINQSINQSSINQSINQSTNQSINQSIIPIWYDYTSLVDQIVILSVFFATTTNSKIAIQYLDWNIFESGAKHNKTEPNQTIQYLITTGTVLDKTSHLLLEHDQYGL